MFFAGSLTSSGKLPALFESLVWIRLLCYVWFTGRCGECQGIYGDTRFPQGTFVAVNLSCSDCLLQELLITESSVDLKGRMKSR